MFRERNLESYELDTRYVLRPTEWTNDGEISIDRSKFDTNVTARVIRPHCVDRRYSGSIHLPIPEVFSIPRSTYVFRRLRFENGKKNRSGSKHSRN